MQVLHVVQMSRCIQPGSIIQVCRLRMTATISLRSAIVHVWLVLKATRGANVALLAITMLQLQDTESADAALGSSRSTDGVMLNVHVAREQRQRQYRAGEKEHIMCLLHVYFVMMGLPCSNSLLPLTDTHRNLVKSCNVS